MGESRPSCGGLKRPKNAFAHSQRCILTNNDWLIKGGRNSVPGVHSKTESTFSKMASDSSDLALKATRVSNAPMYGGGGGGSEVPLLLAAASSSSSTPMVKREVTSPAPASASDLAAATAAAAYSQRGGITTTGMMNGNAHFDNRYDRRRIKQTR
jgi:hypothetical protein